MTMAQAQLLPLDVELPLDLRLPRIGSVDAVALEARAGELAKRSIKKDVEARCARPRDPDDGSDDPRGRRHAGQGLRPVREGDAPGSGRPVDPLGGRGLRLPEPRRRREEEAGRLDREGRLGRDRVPVGPVADRGEARGRSRGRRARRRRDRHGDRPRRVPLRPLREGRRRDRARQGGVRRRPPEGDPRDGRARHLRQRAPRVAARDRRGRRLHQDVDRQGEPGRDAAGDALHARGDPRRPRRDRASSSG